MDIINHHNILRSVFVEFCDTMCASEHMTSALSLLALDVWLTKNKKSKQIP